ncbi:hypothetical protein RQN30_11510 [Arcanobacterium hippocoleae]
MKTKDCCLKVLHHAPKETDKSISAVGCAWRGGITAQHNCREGKMIDIEQICKGIEIYGVKSNCDEKATFDYACAFADSKLSALTLLRVGCNRRNIRMG